MYGRSAQDHWWLRLRCKGAIGLSRGTATRVASRKKHGPQIAMAYRRQEDVQEPIGESGWEGSSGWVSVCGPCKVSV